MFKNASKFTYVRSKATDSGSDESCSDEELEEGLATAHARRTPSSALPASGASPASTLPAPRAMPPSRSAPAAPVQQASASSSDNAAAPGIMARIFGAAKPANAAPAPAAASSSSLSPAVASERESRRTSPAIYGKKKGLKKAAVNVISVELGALVEKADLATGDPIFCPCGAALSSISVLSPATSAADMAVDGQDGPSAQVWQCEFCGTHTNRVELEPEEKPVAAAVDYLLVPAPASSSAASSSSSAAVGESVLLYVVDTSGSMCVTEEVKGAAMRGDRKASLQHLNSFNDDQSSQRMPNETRNATYVSRLQAVQASMEKQLSAADAAPAQKIGLIAFSSDVTIIGDGTKAPVTLAGDKLSNYEQCLTFGKEHASLLSSPVSSTAKSLIEKIYKLEESGATALGPAIVAAVGMCESLKAKSGPGFTATIVLCTDGMSNVGVGALDEIKTEADQELAQAFYDQLGNYAKTLGIVFNVFKIGDADAKMQCIGTLNDLTAGRCDIVSVTSLHQQFTGAAQTKLVATNAQVNFFLHSSMFVREQDAGATAGVRSNRLAKDVGNVVANSELTFEYGHDLSKPAPAEGEKLPFQLQVRYTRLDGSQYVRVMTQTIQATTQRATAEKEADIGVIGTHAMQAAARLAKAGDYTNARKANLASLKMMSRAAESDERKAATVTSWVRHADNLDSAVLNQQRMEMQSGLDLSDDDEDAPPPLMESSAAASVSAPARLRNKKASRAQHRSDSMSNPLYQASSASKSSWM